jgi:Holliday junction resolvase-like predicted endonuclease
MPIFLRGRRNLNSIAVPGSCVPSVNLTCACARRHFPLPPDEAMIASALPRALNVLASVTQATLRVLDRFGAKRRSQKDLPLHQQIGRQGEEDAYFYLRKRGYMMVGRNYRSPARRGEIDLIGWDGDILCFIEVKTRASHHVKPAEVPWTAKSVASWQAWHASTSPPAGGALAFRRGQRVLRESAGAASH